MFIVPEPKKYIQKDGNFYFSQNLVITIPENSLYPESIHAFTELFKNYTAGKTDIEFLQSKKLGHTAVISEKPFDVCTPCIKSKSDYEYELEIRENFAMISFSETIGLIHALIGFLQLIRIEDAETDIRLCVPCYDIYDKPDIAFRAIHLCVFHQTSLSFLKKAIALCGMTKCSHIIIEFWGMYRYECCPEISWKEAYTKEDILPLIKYANGLGLEVIPMLNHLGHASQGRICFGKHSALDNNLSLAPLFEDDGWSWCTTNPKTLRLLEECRRELIELCGKGSYFHIGFDEAYTFGTCRRCSKKDRNELMKEHLINITEDLKKYGRRPIMWSDMMHKNDDYDNKMYWLSGHGEYKIRPELPRDIIMAEWQYICTEEFKTAKSLAADGFAVLTCPWDTAENIDAAVNTAKNNTLMGVIGTTWHTLSQMQWLIPYISDKMWGEANLSIQEYQLCCSYHVRRCVPAEGRYENAGFSEQELSGHIY